MNMLEMTHRSLSVILASMTYCWNNTWLHHLSYRDELKLQHYHFINVFFPYRRLHNIPQGPLFKAIFSLQVTLLLQVCDNDVFLCWHNCSGPWPCNPSLILAPLVILTLTAELSSSQSWGHWPLQVEEGCWPVRPNAHSSICAQL